MNANRQELKVSTAIEQLLIQRNLRGMQTVQQHLPAGYLNRAAELVINQRGPIVIGTGFPVADTFETDGPAGALALCRALQQFGADVSLACTEPLASVLSAEYAVDTLPKVRDKKCEQIIEQLVRRRSPCLTIAVEHPGAASDGHYYNIRGEDISAQVGAFDWYIKRSNCPCIGIGDGGNELGMGNVEAVTKQLNIIPSASTCSELIVADVSNWGAYGLIAMLNWKQQRNLLQVVRPLADLEFLVKNGAVDGISGQPQISEDGLGVEAGLELLHQLDQIVAPNGSLP